GLVGSKHLAPPALATAMDGVLAAVAVELYCIAIQHEAAVVYAVGHAAHGGTKGRRFGGIIVYMGKPLHHVTEFTRCIRHHQRNDPAAVVGYASLHAVCIADHVQVGRVTVYHRLEISSIQSRLCFLHIGLGIACGQNSYHHHPAGEVGGGSCHWCFVSC